MSASKSKTVYSTQNVYTDRAKEENENFPELTVKLDQLDTAMLLLSSNEERVLMVVFKHITDFARKQEENVEELKEMKLLELLLEKDFFIENGSCVIRRFALFLATTIVESMSTLEDLDTSKTTEIMDMALRFYLAENDDFCLEYLSVMINNCLSDPQVARNTLDNDQYVEKFFQTANSSVNPDIMFHSIEAIHKFLHVQKIEQMREFVADQNFPIDRIICDLTNEFPEICSATLKVIKVLIQDDSDLSPFKVKERVVTVLQQLTKAFCDNTMAENAAETIDVLATAMRSEKMTRIFFEQNLFDKIVRVMEAQDYTLETKCKVVNIFAEAAQYETFLYRLHMAKITQLFLDCLLNNAPSTHVLLGLNRMMKFGDAAQTIVNAYEFDLIPNLINIIMNPQLDIKIREIAATLVGNLLIYASHATITELSKYSFPEQLAEILGMGLSELSIDFILSLLNIIMSLSDNEEYRILLAETTALIENLDTLLRNSFSTAILVNNIFRCLSLLIEEPPVRKCLLALTLASSIKRGLKSLSNLVKTSVTNFIMLTTRFPDFVHMFIDAGILEVLIMHQKHSHCIATWNPAIECILSKSPTLKFCIRNQLGFNDTTVGIDFLVSKDKFEDFRILQHILKEEVSPLHPILVVNFQRTCNPEELVRTVPHTCFGPDEAADAASGGWCYCRSPGDPFLPKMLKLLQSKMEEFNLVENPAKLRRCIDFDNVAKRAKVIAALVAVIMSENLEVTDLNSNDVCSQDIVKAHMHELSNHLHCNFIPIGMVHTGCQFERAILFKALADQIGLPATLLRSVDGKILFNEVPLPVEIEQDKHCDKKTLEFIPWRLLRPTHIVDLMYNIGELYQLQSRQALQYLRLY